MVRGTTSKKIVALVREAGAREVHMRIAQKRIAGRRIAVMAAGDMTFELADDFRRIKIIADQPQRAVRIKLRAVEADDTRRFLPPVLQRVQTQRRMRRRFGVAENAEHAAFVVKMVVVYDH